MLRAGPSEHSGASTLAQAPRPWARKLLTLLRAAFYQAVRTIPALVISHATGKPFDR